MVNLDGKARRKRRKVKVITCLVILAIGVLALPFASRKAYEWLQLQYTKEEAPGLGYGETYRYLFSHPDQDYLILLGAFFGLYLSGLWYMTLTGMGKVEKTNTIEVTDKIRIPAPVGDGQFGTARFLKEKELRELFGIMKESMKDGQRQEMGKENVGAVLGRQGDGILYLPFDVNTILVGSTRSGKTRRVLLQTVWARAACGKSMLVNDPKGELYTYTAPYLEAQGYQVHVFDVREPLKSDHYNYMHDINQAVDARQMPEAIDRTWDLVSVLVGVPKGEPLWTNGEAAVIAAGILIVACEAEAKYRNLTNVYYFLSEMCKEGDGGMPISSYLAELPDSHPAKGVFAAAEISPEKMRGSFFGSALVTLRLFTNWNIADMASASDYEMEQFTQEKTAVFVISPDERTTLNSLVALYVNQAYVAQVRVAGRCGGRVPVEMDFLLDEFGNLPTIPSFGAMMSAGLSRGLRFLLAIQDYQQLEKAYREDYRNIKGNCNLIIYLKTTSPETMEEISKRTGKYTIQVNSLSNSVSERKDSASYSSSANLQGRELLRPEEVGRLESPYGLVLYAGSYPAILYSPDLSQYKANADFGMGTQEENRKLQIERQGKRKAREQRALELWGIWKQYTEPGMGGEEAVSFLDLE